MTFNQMQAISRAHRMARCAEGVLDRITGSWRRVPPGPYRDLQGALRQISADLDHAKLLLEQERRVSPEYAEALARRHAMSGE